MDVWMYGFMGVWMYDIAGVGITPIRQTLIPEEISPACNADSNIFPEMRVSFPIIMLLFSLLLKTLPIAQPGFSIKSGVIG
jgi:hypothetical protein